MGEQSLRNKQKKKKKTDIVCVCCVDGWIDDRDEGMTKKVVQKGRQAMDWKSLKKD